MMFAGPADLYGGPRVGFVGTLLALGSMAYGAYQTTQAGQAGDLPSEFWHELYRREGGWIFPFPLASGFQVSWPMVAVGAGVAFVGWRVLK